MLISGGNESTRACRLAYVHVDVTAVFARGRALLYIWWLLEKPVQRRGKKDERWQAKGQNQPFPILDMLEVSLFLGGLFRTPHFWRTLWNSSSLVEAALICRPVKASTVVERVL